MPNYVTLGPISKGLTGDDMRGRTWGLQQSLLTLAQSLKSH